MYQEFFQLNKRPFSNIPSSATSILYPSFKDAYQRCCEGIDDQNSLVLIVGASGCGKSTLLALLEERLANQLTAVKLSCAAIGSPLELLQCLMFELGHSFQSQSEGELRLELIDQLKSAENHPQGVVFLIDEAHRLSHEVLEELRMISNLVYQGRHQVRLVIAGNRSLEEKLAHPLLDSMQQRIGTRCYLNPMSRQETLFYILGQLQLCGQDGRSIFHPSALTSIYELTDGVPRMVSQLADHVLKLAARTQISSIDESLVSKAWNDFHQLPSTELAEAPSAFPAGNEEEIIEYGSLDDEPSSEPPASVSPASPELAPSYDEPAAAVPQPAPQPPVSYEEPVPVESTSDSVAPPNDSFSADDLEMNESLDHLLEQLNELQSAEKTENQDSEAPSAPATPSPATPSADELFGSNFSDEESISDLKTQLDAQGSISTSGNDLPAGTTSPPPEIVAENPLDPTGAIQIHASYDPSLSSTSTPVGPPTSETHITIDGSEIEVVRDDETPPSQPSEETEASADQDSSPPSTGHVVRMDYEDLFQQLRNENHPNQES